MLAEVQELGDTHNLVSLKLRANHWLVVTRDSLSEFWAMQCGRLTQVVCESNILKYDYRT